MIKRFCDHCGEELNSNFDYFVLFPSNLRIVKGSNYLEGESLINKEYHLCKKCKNLLENNLLSFVNIGDGNVTK